MAFPSEPYGWSEMSQVRLTDAQVAEIRRKAAEGVSRPDIAETFGVSERHVARIVRGDSRAQLLGLDLRTLRRSTVEAVDRLLDGLELEPHDEIAAAAARGLAEKVDALRGAE